MSSIVATFGGDTAPLRAAFGRAGQMARDSAREQAAALSQVARLQQQQLELECLRATAAGNHVVADSIQQEIDLRAETLRLTRELGIAEHDAMAIARERLALNRQITASGNRNGHGQGLSGGTGARIIGDTINSVTGSSGAVSLINTLRHMPKPLLAVAGPIVAIGIALKKLRDSILEVDKVNQEARKESFKNVSNQVKAGPEAARASVEAKNKQIDQLTEKSSGVYSQTKSWLADKIFNRKGAGVRNSIGFWGDGFDISTEGNAQEKSLALQNTLEKQRQDLLFGTSKRLKEDSAARKELATGSEFDLAVLEEKKATEEKIAQIRNNAPEGASNTAALVQHEQALSEIRLSQIAAKKSAAHAELDLEHELIHLHAQGNNEEVRAAEARLKTAQAVLQATQALSLEEQHAAKSKVDAAQIELELTRRRRVEQVAQIALQKKVAELIAPDFVKQGEDIEGRLSILNQSISTARPDERAKLEAERASVLAEQRAHQRAGLEKSRHIQDSQIEETTGYGDAEHLAALNKRIKLDAERIKADEKAGNVDLEQIAASRAQLAILIKERDHLALVKSREVGYAKESNRILEAEIGRHSLLAEQLRTELSFAEQINQARDNGDEARVKELQQAKALTLEKQAQAAAIARGDRTRLSLSELAKNGEGQTGAIARRIVRLEKRSAQEAGRGNQAAAQKYQSQADELRNNLDALKDGEKPRDGAVIAPGKGGNLPGELGKLFPKGGKESSEEFKKLSPVPAPNIGGKLKESLNPLGGLISGFGGSKALGPVLTVLGVIAANTNRFVIKNR